ncbi:MAG: PRC-barrel domain-containing protein [Spirochaetaceae bacterium]
MLRNMNNLKEFAIQATDGDIGKAKYVLFDDEDWTVRYLVVQTGSWVSRKTVLISPIFITGVRWPEHQVTVNLTREQVRHSPDLNTKEPISRRQEREYYKYFKTPAYWTGYGLWGTGMHPEDVLPIAGKGEQSRVPQPTGPTEFEDTQTHLRSSAEVEGYTVFAHRGEFGKVADFIFDEKTWAIRYLVVSTGRILSQGRRVLISPRWAKEISWKRRQVFVDMENTKIEDAPEYVPGEPVTPDYEERLFRFYGRIAPWKRR